MRLPLLDARIRRLIEEKNELSDQLRRLKLDLEEEKSKTNFRERPPSISSPTSPNGPLGDIVEWQSKFFFCCSQSCSFSFVYASSLSQCCQEPNNVTKTEWTMHLYIQIEEAVSKQINEYKIKLQKAEQEIATLQATVSFFSLDNLKLRLSSK